MAIIQLPFSFDINTPITDVSNIRVPSIRDPLPRDKTGFPYDAIAFLFRLNYRNGYSSGDRNFCSYIPDKIYDKYMPFFHKEGYVRFSDTIETMSGHLMSEFKDVLQQNGLKTTGKKAELMQRIKDNIPEERISNIFHKRYTIVTDKGGDLLDYFHTVILWDRDSIFCSDKELKLIHKYRLAYPDSDDDVVMFGAMQEKIIQLIKKRQWDSLSSCFSLVADFLSSPDRVDESALCTLLVFYIESSGCTEGDYISDLEYLSDRVSLPKYFDIDERPLGFEWFRDSFFHYAGQLEKILPFHYFTVPQAWELLIADYNDDEAQIKALYKRAKKRPHHDADDWE